MAHLIWLTLHLLNKKYSVDSMMIQELHQENNIDYLRQIPQIPRLRGRIAHLVLLYFTLQPTPVKVE